MHTDAVRHAILDNHQLANLSKHFLIKGEIPLGELNLVTYTLSESSLDFGNSPDKLIKKFLQGLPGNTNVAIAAAVTAYFLLSFASTV